jgi:hypothetical protein
MEKSDSKRVALNIEQSKLEEEVRTVTCSLTKLMEDILGIRRDMTQMSTNLHVEIEELKNLLLNMSSNKRGHTKRKHKDTKATSTSCADQGGEQAMEGYDEIAPVLLFST